MEAYEENSHFCLESIKKCIMNDLRRCVGRSLSNNDKQTSKDKLKDKQANSDSRSRHSKHENLEYARGDITSQLGNDVGIVSLQHGKNEIKILPETTHKYRIHSIWIINGIKT